MATDEFLKQEIKQISENYTAEKTGGFISGDGPIPCNILFVGEAPGKTEVEEGKPFVGMAGKNFEKFLTSIGLSRNEVRITNTCFFRPIKTKEGTSGRITISNRPPKTSEVNLFREILNKEIELVNPKIIVTLGNIPLKRLTNFKSIGECHGNLFLNTDLNRYVFPMYHPSALTYNRNEEFYSMYKEDWTKLKEALNKI
ncbi:uracil-DNA glycosylase [Clostridium sp. P21]|uniref:Uracil-DNA glycosylase n=1 Tax=Clostridium muellerianum TaxID=2716538 RepID=A0A7Y0EJH5_9CLOT|nr:uracil-DNA glycosylase [Clostridium muellerianum]NMM64522.1 uracil-DNA glycosylase [Clostridium muellerianum]